MFGGVLEAKSLKSRFRHTFPAGVSETVFSPGSTFCQNDEVFRGEAEPRGSVPHLSAKVRSLENSRNSGKH